MRENDYERARPGANKVDDKHVPALVGVVRVEERPHGADDVAVHGGCGGDAELPGEVVPPVVHHDR